MRRSSRSRSRRASQVFFAPFIGKAGFPRTGNIPSSKKQFQPRLGLVWSPGKQGKRWFAVARHYYARRPGWTLASTASTQRIGGPVHLSHDSTFNWFRPDSAAYDQLVPSHYRRTCRPIIRRLRDVEDFTNPRAPTPGASQVEQALASGLEGERRLFWAKTVHASRFVDRQ